MNAVIVKGDAWECAQRIVAGPYTFSADESVAAGGRDAAGSV
jgi:hypothetical protein